MNNNMGSLPSFRRDALAFLIYVSDKLKVFPVTKYTALSFFGDRSFPALSRYALSIENVEDKKWIDPPNLATLQLFALISLWIAVKIHERRTIRVGHLKCVADDLIEDRHFTLRDFIDAVIRFEIKIGGLAFLALEDIISRFRSTACIGKSLKPSACLDILDLMYETENFNLTNLPVNVFAAAISIVAFVLTVPPTEVDFPMLPWLKKVCNCDEREVKKMSEKILVHVYPESAESAVTDKS